MNRERTLKKPLVRAEGLVNVEVELPEVPIAVRLDDRAIALEGIMAYLNVANRVQGSAQQLASGGGKFRERYGQHAAEVQQGAARSRDELLATFQEGIRTLAAEDALRAGGMDEADIEIQHVSLQAGINREFGVGRATAAKRAKVVKTAKNAARHVIK